MRFISFSLVALFAISGIAYAVITTVSSSVNTFASILNWQVRGKGRNRVFWNGYDHDNLVKLTGSDQLALLVTDYI